MNEKQMEESIKAVKSNIANIEVSLNLQKQELEKLLEEQRRNALTVSYYGTVFKANAAADAQNSDHYVWVYSRWATSEKPVLNHETPAMKHTSEQHKQTIPFSHSMLYGFAKVYQVTRGDNSYFFALFSGNSLNLQSCFTDGEGAEIIIKHLKGTVNQDLDPRSKLKENELFVKDLTDNDVDTEYLFDGETVKLVALLPNGARFFKHDHSPDLCLDRMAVLSFKSKEPEYILADELTKEDIGKYYKIVTGTYTNEYDNRIVMFSNIDNNTAYNSKNMFVDYLCKDPKIYRFFKTTKLIPSTKEEFDAQFTIN